MKNVQSIETEILDSDGSCRDINIEDMNVEEAIALFQYISEHYEQMSSAVNSEGEELIDNAIIQSHIKDMAKAPGSIHSTWINEKELISFLQVYFCTSDLPNKIFIELTFFPKDVSLPFEFSLFQNLLSDIKRISTSSSIYVRYENASWKYGDVSKQGGVIYYERENHG